MKKTLHKQDQLTKRLAGYSASAGALLAIGTAANGQVIYSGVQDIELNFPADSIEIDLDGDLVNDFKFLIYGW